MALKVYATFEPDGTFPAILAKDVEMPDGKRLSEVEFGGGGGGSCNCPDDLIVDGCTTLLNNPAMEFIYFSGDGPNCHVAELGETNIGLVDGVTYRVTIGTDEYMVTAIVQGEDGLKSGMLGNMSLFGGEDTGEPFAFQEMTYGGNSMAAIILLGEDPAQATITRAFSICVDSEKINEAYLPEEKRPTRIDLSRYSTEGVIVEHYADESTVTHTVEFSNGKPVSVTTNGVTTTLEW
jgi:hypothetical protein